MIDQQKADVLIIGGGAAGLRAAIEAAKHVKKVVILSKDPPGKSGITPVAGEGVEAAVGVSDSPSLHFEDTVKAGRGIADENLIEILALESPQSVDELSSYGAQFKRNADGRYLQSPRPGQKVSRNCFIIGGGYGMTMALRRELRNHPQIQLIEDTVAISIIKINDIIHGAFYLDVRAGKIKFIKSNAIIIATGGYEELWKTTDTSTDSTGECLAIAFNLGAKMIDLEMVLHYPTVIIYPQPCKGCMVQYEYIMNPQILDGRIKNGAMEEFVTGFPARDEFVKKAYNEIHFGKSTPHGGFYMDLISSPKRGEELTRALGDWLNVQFNHLLRMGIDIREKLIEMAPAAHFTLGGIKIDENCETNINGLFVAGEASANLHGANRLSGNALSETQVFGARAGKKASEYTISVAPDFSLTKALIKNEMDRLLRFTNSKRNSLRPLEIKRKLQKIMDEKVSLSRNKKGLDEAVEEIKELSEIARKRMVALDTSRYCFEIREAYEAEMMIELAELVTKSAEFRKETRGHHWRDDFPESRDEYKCHTLIYKQDNSIALDKDPIGKAKIIR